MTLFEKLTDGLQLYEVVLMVMGSFLFIALLILLIIFAAQRRNLKPLLLFKLLAILMLVWPSIQKLSIESIGTDIETKAEAYAQNPTPEKKEEVEALIVDLKNKEVKNPELVTTMARAEYLIGNEARSVATLDKLPPAEQQSAAITNLRKSIEISSELKTQLKVVEERPMDSAAVKKLNAIKLEAQDLPVKSAVVKTNVSAAGQKVNTYRVRKDSLKKAEEAKPLKPVRHVSK